MHNKVTWKKGMRLTTEVFNAMDKANDIAIRQAAMIGSANQYGLFSTNIPFELAVNFSSNMLEVTTLRCHGVTKAGCIVDINFDSNYTCTFDTRISIPAVSDTEALYLVVKVEDDKWREISDTHSELCYSFELIGENSIVPDNCLVIGMVVNQFGWRLNDTDFVPPCLYVSSHPKFVELLDSAKSHAKEIMGICLNSQNCIAKSLITEMWREAAHVYSTLENENSTLTPGQLLSAVERLTDAFLIGCFADEYVSLENQEPYVRMSQMAFDAKHLYEDIDAALSLCAELTVKLHQVSTLVEVEKPAEPQPAPKTQPEPKPAPKPEPKSKRKLWEGIEI